MRDYSGGKIVVLERDFWNPVMRIWWSIELRTEGRENELQIGNDDCEFFLFLFLF